MNRLNNGIAVLLTVVLLSIGVASVGCDEAANGGGAATVPVSAKLSGQASLHHIWIWRR